jgi:putative tryptophan/tyrosine transport system substrate-binding protein
MTMAGAGDKVIAVSQSCVPSGKKMPLDQLKRREFIAVLAGASAAWPLAVHAQQHVVEPITMPVQSSADIERGITSLGRDPGGGFVAMGDPFILIDRGSTLLLAERNKIPAVYFHAVFARDGGLLSYGPDNGDIFRRATPYVDRILRGAKPADLPVQVPTKFEMAVNLKAANALGLEVPLHLQQLADEVIE